MTYQLIQNDILKWAASYTGPKFHALFGDPPYHLTITKRFGKPGSAPAKYGKDGAFSRASKGFMGQAWDGTDESGIGIAFQPETWAALGEHLHPGGFLMAFAGTRGYHRMACAIEDAGFIIHPALVWTFLSGFPKATRIDRAIDRAAGVEVSQGKAHPAFAPRKSGYRVDEFATNGHEDGNKHAAQTELAQTWAGHRYGLQALKPALEFIAVAQKPYGGRPVDCITQTGAGALNIDNGRISTNDNLGGGGYMTPMPEGWDRPWRHNEDIREEKNRLSDERVAIAESLGRWPANLLLDEAGAALLDAQSGNRPAGGNRTGNEPSPKTKDIYGEFNANNSWESYGDSGGASRMFFQSSWQYEILEQLENADPLRYEPKVSTAERSAGLDDPNPHPTLKPISLTKYLASLLLPPDAYAPRRILCPFSGAGSEMIGAILAGWDEVIGIEKTPAYIPIAEKRLAWWSQWPGWGQTDVDKILASLGDEAPAEQLTLFEAAQ